MDTQQHTPGPWNYSGPTISGRFSIYANGPLAYSAGVSDYGDAAEANARLISSAPDLLDALDWALRQIEDDLDPDHQAAFDAACSTLAKAKGVIE